MYTSTSVSHIPEFPERHNALAYPGDDKVWGPTQTVIHFDSTRDGSLDQYGPKGTRFHA